MEYRVMIVGEPVIDIYGCQNTRYWFITEKVRKHGQQFLSGFVRCFKPLMLAEFKHLPEEIFDDMGAQIRRVPREQWPRCPCVDIETGAPREIVRFAGRDNEARLSFSRSYSCKGVDKKMDAKMKNKLDAYLELLEEISEKTDDETTAVALLQEISKDRRMERIKEEQGFKNGDQPATDKQKKFMTKLGVEFTDDITKKQASFLIDAELGKIDSD